MRFHQPLQRCGVGSKCGCSHEDQMAGIHRDIQRATNAGAPLPAVVRAPVEQAYGHDFTGVRIHTGAEAARVVAGLGAQALTVGTDILFGAGQFRPGTAAGDHVLRHELAHVVQQAHGLPRTAIDGGPTDPLEIAAEQAAAGTGPAARLPSSEPSGPGPPAVQRLGDPAQAPPGLACARAVDSPAGVVSTYLFARGSSALSEPDRLDLAAVAAAWAANGGRIRVDGHASLDGPQDRNWQLSCDRALTVAAELTAPATAGAPIVPNTVIDVFAHGEGDELGAAQPANRAVTLSVQLPVPAPAAPAPAGPRCGPDVSAELRAVVARTRATFAGWSAADRNRACGALTSFSTGAIAWDIHELHNNRWILGYRPACATAGATPPCGSTVAVDGECSYAGSPNYVIFGVMCRLCRDHHSAAGSDLADDFTEAEMLDLIDLYKGTGLLGLGEPSANFGPSNDWARAGYRGWPAVPSPAGDRPTCLPLCPTPYAGGAFRTTWVPMGTF